MSRCEEHISRIDLYLYDELNDEESKAFEKYIKECLACRQDLAERRQ
jgi:anti-sigma factor RsiW